MSLPFNIAIDGHSSCGKSTIAKSIAVKYNMKYVDTGAMYRALTLFCMQNKIISNKKVNTQELNKIIDKIQIYFEFNHNTQKSETVLNNCNVEDLIRGIDVSDNVSMISEIQMVRNKLIILQQKMSKNGNVVMEGRDIGSKVLPHAKLKFFITANIQVRAQRRYSEMIKRGDNVTFEEVISNLNNRDDYDSNREINPLVVPEDAVLLDNSNISLLEQNELIHKLVERKLIES